MRPRSNPVTILAGVLVLLTGSIRTAECERPDRLIDNNIEVIYQQSHQIAGGTPSDTVAVLPFANATGDPELDWLCLGISETIMADLLSQREYVLVERLQLWRIMEEQALQLTGAVDEATALEIGKILGAHLLIVGAFQRAGTMMRLTARFVEARSGNVLRSTKVTGAMADIFDLQDQIVSTLVTEAKAIMAQTRSAPLMGENTKSLLAYRHFGEGVLRQARRDYAGAWHEFQLALQADPDFALAREHAREVFMPQAEEILLHYEVVTGRDGESGSPTRETWQSGPVLERAGRTCSTLVRHDPSATPRSLSPARICYFAGSEGVYLVSMDRPGPGGEIAERTRTSPLLMVPWEPSGGREWSGVGGERTSGGKSVPVARDRGAVLGRERVKMAGGENVQCYVIRHQPLQDNSGEVLTLWFAPGIGVVQAEVGPDLKSGGGSGAVARTIWSLVDYRF